jgi:hypothetical protein
VAGRIYVPQASIDNLPIRYTLPAIRYPQFQPNSQGGNKENPKIAKNFQIPLPFIP